MTIEEAKKQMEVAEKASSALTALELKVGIDPENLVTNTHNYVESLQAEKQKVDSAMRRNMVLAARPQEFNDIIKKKSQVPIDVVAARRQLQIDKEKINEINTELKQLKDIELMATGLEVAKYLAKEKARHNFEVAVARSKLGHPEKSHQTQVPSSPKPAPPPAPSMLLPGPVQPLITSSYQPPVPQIDQRQPQMAMFPYAAVYTPQIIPSHPVVQMFTKPQVQNPLPGFNQPFMGEQRHHTKPVANPVYQQPLNQYFSNFIQPNAGFGSFVTRPQYSVAPPLFNVYKQMTQTPLTFNRPHTPKPAEPEHHVEADQKHIQSSYAPIFTFKPFQNYHPVTVPFIASYTQSFKENKVGLADHENNKNEHHQGNNGNHDDWGGALSFPGDTYSPPPSWIQTPKASNMRNKPSSPPSYSQTYQKPPINNLVSRPAIPLTAIANQPQTQQNPPTVPAQAYQTPQTVQQQPAFSTPIIASYMPISQPAPAQQTSQPFSSFIQNIASYQPTIFDHKEQVQKPVVTTSSFASPQEQQAKIGEVIQVAPAPEHTTVNHKPPPPPPPPPPAVMSGNLPGYLGAVDMAKYDLDVADRLRQQNVNGSNNNNNNSQSNGHRKFVSEDEPKPDAPETGK